MAANYYLLLSCFLFFCFNSLIKNLTLYLISYTLLFFSSYMFIFYFSILLSKAVSSVIQVNSNLEALGVELFENTENVIKLDTDTTYIYDRNSEYWYSYQLLGDVETKLVPRLFPITGCLDMIHGSEGGYIRFTYSASLAFTKAIELQTGYVYSGEGFNFIINTEAGTSISFAEIVNCDSLPGQIGQFFCSHTM